MAFGDLFLEDVKRYRERLLTDIGLKPVFLLWGFPTNQLAREMLASDQLAREMLASGFRMIVTCVDPTVLPREFVGRDYDHEFLKDLPKGIDPCLLAKFLRLMAIRISTDLNPG